MKSLRETLNEALVNEARHKITKTTVGEYVAWFFGVKSIDDLTDEDFEMTDFDPESLENDFDGDYSKQLEWLKDHANEKIKLDQLDHGDDVESEFECDGIVFKMQQMDLF